MSKDYIPRTDGSFDAWVGNFSTSLHDWWSAQGYNMDDLTPLEKAQNEWAVALEQVTAAHAALAAAAAAKKRAREALEPIARSLAAYVQANFVTTDADRAQMGLTVRRISGPPSPAPSTRPLVSIDTGQRLSHTLRITDAAQPTRKRRPESTLGAQVWVKLVNPGEPVPTSPDGLTFLDVTTRTPYRAQYTARDGGKTAVYMLRWLSKRGEPGPWSEVMSATVAA